MLVPAEPSCNDGAQRNLENLGMLDVQGETMTGAMPPTGSAAWSREAAWSVYQLPFNDLLFRAQSVHRQNFDPNRVQLSKLLNIKTGGCPEDCGYCS